MDKDFWEKTWSRKYERYVSHHREMWKTVWPYLQGNVIDLGCGPCVMYEEQHGIGLVGVDWSVEALFRARKHFPCGVYIQADVRRTGLPSGQFDTVVMSGLLDYFEDWSTVMAEAKRLVKPDGKIVATLLNGYKNHDWSRYPRISGNWHVCVL